MLIHASRVADLAQATIAVGISRRTSPDLSLPVIEIALRNGSALRCMGTCVVAWRWWPKGRLTPITKCTSNHGIAWQAC
jgi:hypothetical protein